MTRGVTRDRVARIITETGSPALVVLVLPLVVAGHATGYRLGPTVLWGLVVATFSSVLPMAFIVRGARRGRWDGHHVRNREGRLVPLALCLVSTVVGLVILLAGHAPRDVVALDVAMLATLFACTIVTQWWKISLHCTVAGGAVATIVLLYGLFPLVLVPVVAAIAWSRVAAGDHTVPQVIAGSVLGPILGGVVFLLIR
jgi:membrane-associated phospholipid phosphatase